MRDGKRDGAIRGWFEAGRAVARGARGHRPGVEGLEGRQLLTAMLESLPPAAVPADLGLVIPLDGGTDPQGYTVVSDNPSIGASIINGPFVSFDVAHASSGAGDPAFSGTLSFQFFEDLTPIAVRRITALVNQGFYTSPTTNPTPGAVNLPSKNFHRIVAGFPGPEFIVQGGSVNGNGTGEVNQPGFPFRDEFVPALAFTGSGQLAMANAGDDTNSSQFFVTTGAPSFLTFQHTIFGQLVEGFDVLDQMTQVSRDTNGAPVSPILITGAQVSQTSPDGVLLLNTTAAQAGQTATVTVTATSALDGTTDTETFGVVVTPNTDNERPILGPIGDQITPPNQPIQFQLSAITTDPGEVLTYTVAGDVETTPTTNTFTPVQNATATVDANGLVTVTPDADFEGVIDLIVGVRDDTIHSGSTDVNAPANFDTQRITLTVTDNTRPTATPVTTQATQNQPVTIQLAGDTGNPGSAQTLSFELTSIPVNGLITNFDDRAGTLTYTPFTNFTGTDFFTYRVTDVGDPIPNLSSAEAVATVVVQGGQAINTPPTAQPQIVQVLANTPLPVQLSGLTGDPDSGQGLSFAVDTTGTLGTVSNFDPATGAFTYSPPTDFIGNDTLSFTVTDVGDPTPNLTSEPATVSFNIAGAVDTGAVRQIGTVLIVTPPPGALRNPSPNVVDVRLSDGRIAVSVNGQIDEMMPDASGLERLVVYGTKAGDTITVAPDVPLVTTLDGGLGGINNLSSNDLPSRLHGWFGRNTLRGGASDDQLIGRLGHVRFLPSGGNDLLFAGDPDRFPSLKDHGTRDQGQPPTGQFFRFNNGRLVAIPTPPPISQGRIVLHPPDPNRPAASMAAADLQAAQQQRRAELIQARRDRLRGS